MYWSWGDHMGAGGWVGMTLMIVFWIAVVIGIVYLIRYLVAGSRTAPWPQRSPSVQMPGFQVGDTDREGSQPLRTLEKRYVRGEIEREEFLRRKADLTS